MKEKEIKSRPLWIPTWLLSLIALFFIAFLINMINDIGEIFSYITYGVLISVACFFICLKDPKGVWYVPLLCNIFSFLMPVLEDSFWTTSMWIIICSGVVLSVIAAITGALTGRRSGNRSKVSGDLVSGGSL